MSIKQENPSKIFDDYIEIEESINFVQVNAEKFEADSIPSWAINLTMEELNDKVNNLKQEISLIYTLNMIASIEGMFNHQLKLYARKKLKEPWVKPLRKKFKKEIKNNQYIKFEKILDEWKKYDDNLMRNISKLKEFLNIRHWLAHGRHWPYRTGKIPDVYEIYALYSEINVTINFDLNF